MRKTKEKQIQVHEICKCGLNQVYQENFPIRWADFSKLKIKHKKDVTTKKYFLSMKIETELCYNCVIED